VDRTGSELCPMIAFSIRRIEILHLYSGSQITRVNNNIIVLA